MAKWKLVRQFHGDEVFTLSEGEEVTIGRGKMNSISLTSIVVSRDHCVLSIQSSKVIIRDLKSSNGVYVGKTKIPQNTPYVINNQDIIGLGWTYGVNLTEINDGEKYVFRLHRDTNPNVPATIQNKHSIDDIEQNVAMLVENKTNIKTNPGPLLKRKLDEDLKVRSIKKEVKENTSDCPNVPIEDVINITDSESENGNSDSKSKKAKLTPTTPATNIPKIISKPESVKVEFEGIDFEPFDVKQEYLGYDDEPLQVDSDSDSESDQWYIRLSQSSPGKPFTKVARDITDDSQLENNSSYSQIEDFVHSSGLNNHQTFEDDLITIPPEPPEYIAKEQQANALSSFSRGNLNDPEQIQSNSVTSTNGALSDVVSKVPQLVQGDFVDGLLMNHVPSLDAKDTEPSSAVPDSPNSRKAQLINALIQLPRRKSNFVERIDKIKQKSMKSKHVRTNKHTSNKCELSNSQREQRKQKLKEIATKGKKEDDIKSVHDDIKTISTLETSTSRPKATVKLASSNRGAFLATRIAAETVEKTIKKPKSRSKDKVKERTSKDTMKADNIENNKQMPDTSEEQQKHREHKEKSRKSKSVSNMSAIEISSNDELITRKPLKSLKPPSDVTIVQSIKSETTKPKKSVRFSDSAPEVHVFEIQPGNKMKKTSLIKTTLVDARQMPELCLEKITLMKILRWNPHWLEEQINNNEPPPILGHNNPPMSIFHSFVNHNQYVQLIGDLLLMEIWECLTIANKKVRNENDFIQMRIESLPPVPTQDRYFELFNLSVNVSLPTAIARMVPKVGEMLLVNFGPENARNQRFFFVHNVRNLPSPANNKNSFFSISLHATFTDKMRSLRPGEVMLGRTLADIKKELMLFEAMEYLAGSPLSQVILKPEPHLFPKYTIDCELVKSKWTATLNESQQLAVSSSVAAALSDQPCVQMVQGPPGTGKSSVICAIVMSYFYDAVGKKQQNRGKILICATSNAAVDELVIRLLNIRQSLPKSERFRMVRVGRAEAMHPRARDVSSQQLAARDVAQAPAQPSHAGLAEEISHLEAKINMWKAAAQDAKDPVRVAYCQGRVADLSRRVALVRGGGGSSACLIQAERRIVEGADIVITTLASAHNHKMRGLKRRIALCIVDEAGQAIEPETLIPLTLDVTRLTLIGDPQQLPGYICSQRAKKHGLSESLFARLASCGEQSGGGPAVLLDRQYRMHPAIADYPNRAFYGGRVLSAAPRRPHMQLPPYAILAIASGDRGQGASGGNEWEAWAVARLAAVLSSRLKEQGLSLAVITPYHAHKDLIKKSLRTLQHQREGGDAAECGVEVNTVDSFQGQERDVVVVSLARSQGVGFLTDAGRMNVMLTRARHALLVCLNPHAMLRNPQWRTLVEDAQRRHAYRELPHRMCRPLTRSQAPHDDIVDFIVNNNDPGLLSR